MKPEKTGSTSQTNWAKLEKMTDDEIDVSDIPPLGANCFAIARLRKFVEKHSVEDKR